MIDLSSIDVMDMLERQGMRNVRPASGGREANFSCFTANHAHGDERPSASMNIETTAWNCLACHARGNAISFVADVQQISHADAQRWLRDTYGIEFAEPRGGSMMAELDARLAPPKVQLERTRPHKSWLSTARIDWSREWSKALPLGLLSGHIEYVFRRGFKPHVLEEWGVGYDYQSDRITFPVYDLDGELLGIKGRSWRPEHQPKYRLLGDNDPNNPRLGFHPYEASEVVYGLHRRRDVRTAVLGEGEWNAWACSQVGVERPVAIGMSYTSIRHAQLLAREVDEVVVFFDPDAAGRSGAFGAKNEDGSPKLNSAGLPSVGCVDMLEPYVNVRVVQGHEHDPAEYLRLGRGSEIIELIESARSSLEIRMVFQ